MLNEHIWETVRRIDEVVMKGVRGYVYCDVDENIVFEDLKNRIMFLEPGDTLNVWINDKWLKCTYTDIVSILDNYGYKVLVGRPAMIDAEVFEKRAE